MRELAHAAGLRFTVEAYGAPCDSIPYGGASDEPMGEFWSPSGAMETCRGMASAGHVYGKRIVGAESFTAADQEKWREHPGSLKALGDTAFCEGINRFVFHRYALQPWAEDRRPGMMMGPWGQHYERTETWWQQSAQEGEARRVVDEAGAVTKVEPAGLIAEYALAAIPARFTIERQDWAGAAALKARSSAGPAAEAITWWARALGAARLGDVATAQQDLAQIQTLKSKLDASPDPNAKYWAGQVEIQHRAAAAWLAHAQRQNDEALRLMRSAVEMEDATEKSPVTPGPVLPAREQIGRAH